MKKLAIEIISILFIILFIYAATSKLIDYDKFQAQLGQSPMLTSLSGLVAWCIPLTEIIIATGLTIERFRKASLYASFGLMVMFSTYIYLITRYSESIPCSCGGILEKMTWNQHLIFNLVFTGLAVAGVVTHEKYYSAVINRGNRKPAEKSRYIPSLKN